MTRIALIQQRASLDKAVNLERGLRSIETAAKEGAILACFAELGFEPFYPQRPAGSEAAELAEPVPGPMTDALSVAARKHGMVIVANLFERDGERTYDTSPVIDADGTILGCTRMCHIAEMECFYEQGYYTPGDTGAPVYDTAVGRIGVAICYDRHYPEYMRALGVAGAELVITPQAGAIGEWPNGLYEAEMRVAAFHNGYFTALVNRVGEEECVTFAGKSFVCSPEGQVLATAPEGKETILYADLDLDQVAASPARKYFFRDRRPDQYGPWI